MKQNTKFFSVILISLLLLMLPVCLAQEIDEDQKIKSQQTAPASYYYNFPGLVSWLAAILYSAGFASVAIGVGVIAGGYVVYRIGEYTWTYYTAYKYSKLTEHAYDHISDFPNIWKTTPSKSKFKKECLNNMNSKSSKIERYIDTSNRNSIAFNPSTEMMTAGSTDGKTIETCTRYKRSDVEKKIKKGLWKRVKK